MTQAFGGGGRGASASRVDRATGRRILELFLRTDLRSVLSSIQAPTLVLHRRDDLHVHRGHAEAIADAIPDARLVELPGHDNAWFAADIDGVLDHIEAFLTGTRAAASTSRVLSTVLFTDIVRSTERAATAGDEAWKITLAAHDALVERHVTSFRGTVVKFTGDGVLATFDGPARAIECARAIRDAVHDLGLQIRAGLHTGEIEVVGDDIAGIGVHVAARIMALAQADEVLVSAFGPAARARLRAALRGPRQARSQGRSRRVARVRRRRN